jgi:hypothetical protein
LRPRKSPATARSTPLWLACACLCCAILALAGCGTWLDWRNVHSDVSDTPEPTNTVQTKLVGDFAIPYNMRPLQVEAVGLVGALPGTGSDPAPGAQRAALVAEMQTRGVKTPSAVLASKNMSLVLVRAYLRAGIQKGDTFDVELRTPSRSETTSLRGGYLLPTIMRQLVPMDDGQIHQGDKLAEAEGPILINPLAKAGKDLIGLCRGRILSGGRAAINRPLALVIPNGANQKLTIIKQLVDAINRRFHTNDKGIQSGVAKAIRKEYIELAVHPRYKDNIERYMMIVRAIAPHESPSEQTDRISLLEKRLLDPNTAADAARQLEAIGRDGIEALRNGLKSRDLEVQFFTAEALAYLDQSEAAEPLGDIARREPAFRVYALTALSAMQDRVAYEQLESLLGMPSAETRYGAFRALWAMNPAGPLVAGNPAVKDFHYVVLNSGGPPMIHTTRSRRPEIVLFGREQRFEGPVQINAGSKIMVTRVSPGEISVARFVVNEPDQKRIVANDVDQVIRAIVDLGGAYPDVVQALEEAKGSGVLPSRLEVDALPEAGIPYDRGGLADDSSSSGDREKAASHIRNPKYRDPIPGLFSTSDGGKASDKPGDDDSPDAAADSADSPEKPKSSVGFFDKMVGHSSN